MKFKNIFLIIILLFSILNTTMVFAETFDKIAISENKIIMNYFYSPGCPACQGIGPYIDALAEKYPEVKLNKYDITSRANSSIFEKTLSENKVPFDQRGRIPIVFIEGEYFIGFTENNLKSIENIIRQNSNNGHELIDINIDQEYYNTKVLGIWDKQISVNNKSLFATTFLLGFFDSLNVCSITVLIFLIIYLLAIGSIKKTFKIGLTFTIVIYLFYFLFMVALTSIIGSLILKYGFYIRLIVFGVSTLIGILLIKDYFFYGKGLTVGVPKSVKPMLEKHLKKATFLSVIVFALLASLVELPCTAVFPLIYSTILAEGGVVGISKLLWIALYNLIYVLPLLLIVFGTYFSWLKIETVDKKIQKHKKILKLIAGILLLLIALYFIYPILF